MKLGELVESLCLVVPGISESDLEALAWALRRVVLGTLVARHADLDETREQLRTPIEVYTNGEQRERRTKPRRCRTSESPAWRFGLRLR